MQVRSRRRPNGGTQSGADRYIAAVTPKISVKEARDAICDPLNLSPALRDDAFETQGAAMALSESDRIYDERLVTLVRSADSRAAERLAARWQPRLIRAARRMLGDSEEAREAVQEAWGGICRGWFALSDPAMFPGWAYGILARKCADRIRRLSASRARSVAEEAAPLRYAILAALGQLSPDHRIAAILYFGEGLTLAEIAAATGVPVGTAKSRIFHARQHLKRLLEGDL
jgi:RNA polymerase sigma factor (sigma-70 family)